MMWCKLRKHGRIRICFALSAGIFASCLVAASDGAADVRACADLGGPSNFDYVVLASLADSPHLLAMASYRTTASQHKDPGPCDEPSQIAKSKPLIGG
jgi:hypothetical protein